MRWLGNFLASSVGRKIVLAATGLLLVGFLLEHIYGNLKLVPPFGAADGSSFEAYRDELHSFGWLLTVAEVGLFALFLAHAFLAFRLTLENREARHERYVVRASRGAKTAGSASMFVTGTLILAYLIKHVTDFHFDGAYQEQPSLTVARTLSRPGNALVYLLAMGVLAVHLSHGFHSAFQSLGLQHPRWRGPIRILGYALAGGLGAGFALIPLYYLFFWSEGGAS